MRNVLLSVLGALVIFAALPALATAATKMPQCSGRVVWIVPAQKFYVLSNNPRYGRKPGAYACESTAVARGYRMRPLNIMRPTKNKEQTSKTATPRPGGSATPFASMSVAEKPSLTTLARSQIDIVRSGHIDRSQYGDQLNKVLTDKIITQFSQALAIGGAVMSFSYAGTANYSGLPVAQYLVAFEHPIGTTNQWIESVAADAAGKVVFLSFTPKS
ncbi:MAG: hypothetical protein JO097_06910 [Acidobacteriaceae bacterium]|nr:hypothetical protein [Acidobacteriaceae bacterium]